MTVMGFEVVQQFVGEVEGLLVACALLVALHLGSSHQSVGLLVFHHVDIIPFALLHALLLLTERAEEVFHQSPVQEGSVFIGPATLHPRKLTDLGNWMQGGGNDTLVLVKIKEHLYFCPDGQTVGHIALGEQYLAFVATI